MKKINNFKIDWYAEYFHAHTCKHTPMSKVVYLARLTLEWCWAVGDGLVAALAVDLDRR